MFLLDPLLTGSHKIETKQIPHHAEVSQKDVVNHQDIIKEGWKSSDRTTCNCCRHHSHSTRTQPLLIMLHTINIKKFW